MEVIWILYNLHIKITIDTLSKIIVYFTGDVRNDENFAVPDADGKFTYMYKKLDETVETQVAHDCCSRHKICLEVLPAVLENLLNETH